ncbi:uncharacterized protein LOC134235894 isoform X2 [Saccostrea cucullata]|uniref:uncharacterized protein LOC134235894 isoform X2 n=1 Tax=Saccostrea cuccullata TaxID=36930 RepID=UPI002ED2D413
MDSIEKIKKMSHPSKTIEVELYWSSTTALEFTSNSSSFDFLNESASSSEHWMNMTEGNVTIDVYNTTLRQTTAGEFKVEEIWEWFVNLTTPTQIVVGTLLCLVLILLIGIICCCCCKRGRLRRDIRRSEQKRVTSEERHYTLPNQIARLSKLRQNFARRISTLWMDREVADGESVGNSRIAQNSPRKDRNVRMPSPTPSLTDRPYMDMSSLTKAHRDSENPKHFDDHDAVTTKGYVKPDRKPPPVPPVRIHPKLQNTDGHSSLKLKNISSPTGELGYYSPQMPVKFQAISSMPGPSPYSTCQQCAMGHFGHGCNTMMQMPIQHSPAPQTMYNNQMYIPEELCHPVGVRTYSPGPGMTVRSPPWKGSMGHVYYHGNMPYNQCIPEVTELSENDTSGGQFFGHQYLLNSRSPLLHDHERMNTKADSKLYDKPLEHEHTYSDVTELEMERHQNHSLKQSYAPEQHVKQSYAPEPPVKPSYAPESPVKQSYETEPPLKQSYVSKPPLKQSYAPEPPVKPSYAPESHVKQSYAPEPPVKQSYAPEPPVKQSYAPKPQVKPSYAPERLGFKDSQKKHVRMSMDLK